MGQRKSHIRSPRTKLQAHQVLQSITKIVYRRLFEEVVARVNASVPTGDYNHIGTLDIYGFERLQVNSFEQLCINLANERLQQFFVEKVLDAEQQLYRQEALPIPAFALPDAAPLVHCIEEIYKILDDQSHRATRNLASDADKRFCEQVHQRLRPTVIPLKLTGSRTNHGLAPNDGFQIKHYAGEVAYLTWGWTEKNNDALVPEVEELLAMSDKELVRSFSRPACTSERFESVSRKYLCNLGDLLKTLQSCQLHYIRCFNPNESRMPGYFNKKYVLDQVVQCGTVELVRIMYHGYPHRCSIQDVVARFEDLLPAEFSRNPRTFTEMLMRAFEIDPSQWTLGPSKLFLKSGQLRLLENLRNQRSTASKEVISCMDRSQPELKVVSSQAYAT